MKTERIFFFIHSSFVKTRQRLIVSSAARVAATMICFSCTALMTMNVFSSSDPSAGLSESVQREAMEAIMNGSIYDLEMLIKTQKPDLKKLGTGKHQGRLLHLAISKEKPKIAEFLFDAGADPNVSDENGLYPIQLAIIKNDSHSFSFLVKSEKTNLNIKNNMGSTPLHLSVLWNRLGMTKALLKRDILLNQCNNSGKTVAHYAATKQDGSYLQALIDAKSDINIKDENGWTPLHEAAFSAQNFNLKNLIAAKADVNAIDKQGHTPIFLAKDYSTFRILAENGANLNIIDLHGRRLLHYANSVLFAQYLVEHGCNPNEVDTDGKTILHFVNVDIDMARYLIKNGAKANIKDKSGKYPADYATDKNLIRYYKRNMKTDNDKESGGNAR